MRRLPPAFYRAGAIASFLSAATTLLLIFLPDFFAPADGFEGRMRRVLDPAYVLRSWAYLLHPMITGAAALAIGLRLRRQAALVIPGLTGFGIWAVTEMAQQTMTLFMFDRWRRAWLAGDEAIRRTMEFRTAIYDGLWDATYNLLLIGLLIGCAFYAVAMIRLRGFSRIVGFFYAGAGMLTLSIIMVELGGPSLPLALDQWLYPAIQPLGRVLIGIWLWKNADESAPIGASAQQRPLNV